MSAKPSRLPDLSQAEWAVMHKVWELKKTNVREVYEELLDAHGWAYNTVRTMMERLREKGYLAGKKVGNMYFYTPRAQRRKTTLAALEGFADRVFDGAVGPIVSHLIRSEKLMPDEMAQIRKMLEEDENK